MPVLPENDPGPFLSGLQWLEGLGQVPLRFFGQGPGAAGRKLADELLQIPDAFIPGNAIPEFSEEDPDTKASELLGVDPLAHPGIAKATDIVGGTIANPATYLGLRGGTLKAGIPLTEGRAVPGVSGAISKAKDYLGQGLNYIPPEVRQTAANTAGAVRRTFNWLDIPEDGQAIVNQAQGMGQQAAQVASERVKQIYQGLSPAEQEAVGEIAHGINRGGQTDRAQWQRLTDVDQYLNNRTDIDAAKVRKALDERRQLMQTLAEEGKSGGVYSATSELPDEYIQRQFTGDYFKDIAPPEFVQRGSAAPAAIKGREEALKDPEGLLKFLQSTPDADLEFNALSADARRAAQQGRLFEKAEVGKRLTGTKDFSLATPEHRAAVDEAIKQIGAENPDYAYRLNNLWRGTAPRSDNWFAKGLHSANKLFKGAATYGILLPRIGFNVRNRIGGLWQALSNDQARGTIGKSSMRALSDLLGSFDDGFVKLTGARKLPASELTSSLDYIDNAMKQAQGSTAKFRELLGQHKDGAMLQEALDNGVLDNFVSSEQLISDMAKTPTKQRVQDWMEWPAAATRGLEQRMRLGTFLDLRKSGVAKDGADAAKTIRDTYLDYSTPGVANRTFRDVVPFGAFLSQNIKQQAGFVARHPVAAIAAAPLFGGSDDENLPKYPWLDQQMALPIGLDEKGNSQYLTSFGLPLEGLTQIPGLSQGDLYRDLVSPLQPLLKTGIAYAADKDPFTGDKFGTYDKLLGEPMGGFGRAVNIAKGTGLTQPITGPLDQVATGLDDRKSILERGLQLATGARFASVDPDVATRQRLEAFLENRPDIRAAPSYYQTAEEKDPELQAVLQELQQTKERLKAKRKLQQ